MAATVKLIEELRRQSSARNQPRSVVVEFPAGELESKSFDLAGSTIVGWLTDNDWTACHITVQLSDGDAWRDLHLAGELVTFDIGPNRATLGIFLPLADMMVRLKRPAKDISRSLRVLLN
jgi:hypothetical protein